MHNLQHVNCDSAHLDFLKPWRYYKRYTYCYSFAIMSFLSTSRPTLPPIRDVFRDEFFSKLDPSSSSPPLTPARTYREARPLPAQQPGRVMHSSYVPPFRYSDTESPCSALLHNRRLSNEHILSRVQPGPPNSFLASSKHLHQVLPQNLPFSTKPRHLRSISTLTDAEDAEAFERTPVARYNRDSDASLASTHPPSFTHGIQHEMRNSSTSLYKCPYCGKVFNRPSSLKVNKIYIVSTQPIA